MATRPNLHPHEALVLDSAPAETPVSLAEMRLHLKIDSNVTEDDALITTLIEAATEQAEMFTRRAFVTQTWIMYLDGFPPNTGQINSDTSLIELPKSPTASVTSVKYYDTDNTEQTLVVDTDYEVDTNSEPARILPVDGTVWPDTRSKMNPVSVEFIAGYGVATAVPDVIKVAIKVMVGGWYENREEIVLQGTPKMTGIQEQLLWGVRLLEIR